MVTATLRNVGGSVMLAIPKPILDGLGMGANEQVSLHIEAGKIVIAPRPRAKYTLQELVAQCDDTAPVDDCVCAFDAILPAGREAL